MSSRTRIRTISAPVARNTGLMVPYWVRLGRAGNNFLGFRSPDGVSWTQVGAINVSMANVVLVGLPVSAHDDSMLNTTLFSNVSIIPASGPADYGIGGNGGNAVIKGNNGPPGWIYCLLASANVDLPLSTWTRLLTKQFNMDGSFAITNAVGASAVQQFYMLELQ